MSFYWTKGNSPSDPLIDRHFFRDSNGRFFLSFFFMYLSIYLFILNTNQASPLTLLATAFPQGCSHCFDSCKGHFFFFFYLVLVWHMFHRVIKTWRPLRSNGDVGVIPVSRAWWFKRTSISRGTWDLFRGADGSFITSFLMVNQCSYGPQWASIMNVFFVTRTNQFEISSYRYRHALKSIIFLSY